MTDLLELALNDLVLTSPRSSPTGLTSSPARRAAPGCGHRRPGGGTLGALWPSHSRSS